MLAFRHSAVITQSASNPFDLRFLIPCVLMLLLIGYWINFVSVPVYLSRRSVKNVLFY